MKQIEKIITDEGVNNNFKFSFEKGEYKGENYEAMMHIACDNPACACGDIIISANYTENNKIYNDANEKKYRFAIDVKNKQINKKFIKDISKNDLNFARSFVKELTDKDWKNFYSFFYNYKQKVTDEYDIEKLKIDFPYHDIEEYDAMTGFSEIFLYSANLIIDHNDLKYLIDDQYCLNSSCDCLHSALTFIEIKDGKVISGYKAPAIIYNYKHNTWELERKGQLSTDELDNLIKETRNKLPDLSNILKKRHGKLRKLYYEFRKRNQLLAVSTVSNPEKVGRNAPCPCGSGKKYKKCCG